MRCQLVPVQFRKLNGRVFNSHQYSVTEYFTSSKINEQVMPAAIFSYDFSPVRARAPRAYRESQRF